MFVLQCYALLDVPLSTNLKLSDYVTSSYQATRCFQAASQLCGDDMVIGAECRVVGGDGTLTRDLINPQIFEPGYECTALGLICQNGPEQSCLDYEIRFECQH